MSLLFFPFTDPSVLGRHGPKSSSPTLRRHFTPRPFLSAAEMIRSRFIIVMDIVIIQSPKIIFSYSENGSLSLPAAFRVEDILVQKFVVSKITSLYACRHCLVSRRDARKQAPFPRVRFLNNLDKSRYKATPDCN